MLAIIADPKSAKDHLEKIRSEMELLHRKAAETAKAAAELDERQRELNEREVALAGADAIINEATRAKDEAAAIKRDLDEQHREHDAREAAIAAREHSLNGQEAVYRATGIRSGSATSTIGKSSSRKRKPTMRAASRVPETKVRSLTWRSFTSRNTPP